MRGDIRSNKEDLLPVGTHVVCIDNLGNKDLIEGNIYVISAVEEDEPFETTQRGFGINFYHLKEFPGVEDVFFASRFVAYTGEVEKEGFW